MDKKEVFEFLDRLSKVSYNEPLSWLLKINLNLDPILSAEYVTQWKQEKKDDENDRRMELRLKAMGTREIKR